MAPLRRYLRITKYSVLEVRIYLDNPAHLEPWLLRRNDPALPRIIEAVRPLVLPKLREENERAGKKGKGKGVKDVVAGDDFEVSIFLTELSSRHTILTKQKNFAPAKPRLLSNSGKLTSWLTTGGTSEKPMEVPDDDGDVVQIREEEQETINLDGVPEAAPEQAEGDGSVQRRSTRNRNKRRRPDSSERLFVGSSSESEGFFQTQRTPQDKQRSRRERTEDGDASDDAEEGAANQTSDDKKKLALTTAYDGFSIYGRILCLVVKRKGGPAARAGADGGAVPASSQQMLENWVSTQAAQEQGEDDDGEEG